MQQQAELVIFKDWAEANAHWHHKYIGHLYVGKDRYVVSGKRISTGGLWIYSAASDTVDGVVEELDDYWFINSFSVLLTHRFALPVSIVRATYCEQTVNQYEALEELGYTELYEDKDKTTLQSMEDVPIMKFFKILCQTNKVDIRYSKFRFIRKKDDSSDE